MVESINISSPWQQLKRGEINCQQALETLVDETGKVNLELLDKEVSYRFLKLFPQPQELPPILPLLLWRNCYYLGSPVNVTSEIIQQLSDRTLTDIQIIPITEKSYKAWFLVQKLDLNKISSLSLVNPITKESEPEDISEITELYLSQASGQIERVKTIISGALRNRASDIHLEPTVDGLRVRYRIDGVLREITTFPLEISRRVVVAIKVMSDLNIADSRRPQDGRIGENYNTSEALNVGLDMRVSTLPCVGGEKVVIRLLPQRNPFTDMSKLGFSDATLKTYKKWLSQPQGMIILTGPTGSGKTSTLYTSLQAVAKESVNVVTVEDPVEYVLSGITQTHVNEAAGMTFAAGLRSILRQDPDIIMVGEIRDSETAETAVRAALTGHLVFTTLHTNNAVGTIPRLKDIGPDPGLISDALLGIVAQRLVRRLCIHCAEPYQPSDEDLSKLNLEPTPQNTKGWRKAVGCPKCFNSGYMGREAIAEVLDVDDRVRELIYTGTMTKLHRYLKETNFISFSEAAIAKILSGLTTIEEVFRVLPHSTFMPTFTHKS